MIAAAAMLGVLRRRLLVGVPALFFKKGGLAEQLIPRLPSLRRGYWPPPLVPGGLLQSAFADSTPPFDPSATFVRETLSMPQLVVPQDRMCSPAVVPEGVVSVDWLEQVR